MGRCKVPNCNGTTEYEESAQAVLCTTCGTVSTQDVLTHEWDGELSGSSLYFGPTTLKSLRRVGGVLTGQSSKEDRDRRNTVAMHQYIVGLLSKLACSGLAARAQALFDQARVRGKYRWGKKSMLVAGACIVVVLRESKKGIMMSHLASLMDVSPHALCRIFMQLTTLLGLQAPPFDPLALLPGLQSHFTTLISSPSCRLPQSIIQMVKPLPSVPVLQLSTSLATLLNRLDRFSSPGVMAPPMACASFILALEGQAALSLPSYTALAEELGKFVGTRKDLVVERYRDISKAIEEWMEDVPWISGADHPDNRLGKKRRKTSHRDVIAMGLKDVVQFQEDIVKARSARETGSPVAVSLEVLEDEDDEKDSTEGPMLVAGRKRKRSESTESSVSSRHLRITRSRRARPLTRLDLASLSLLSPGHLLASDLPLASRSAPEVEALQRQILTSSTFPSGPAPTRLQQLAALRGGGDEIKDEELFEEGELDGFIRSDDEVTNLRRLFGWNELDLSTSHKQYIDDSRTQGLDFDLADMAVWEDLGGDKDVDNPQLFDVAEQVLEEWRAASPTGVLNVGGGDSFDVHGEW